MTSPAINSTIVKALLAKRPMTSEQLVVALGIGGRKASVSSLKSVLRMCIRNGAVCRHGDLYRLSPVPSEAVQTRTRIVEALAAEGPMSSSELAASLSVGTSLLRSRLGSLEGEGIISRVGRSRYGAIVYDISMPGASA